MVDYSCFFAIVLAAGKGTRMRSSKPKVLHRLLDRPLIYYPLEVLSQAGIKRIIVVLGHGAKEIEPHISKWSPQIVYQEEQLGTAHAVSCAMPNLREYSGPCLIMCGDMPLFRPTTIQSLYSHHIGEGNQVTVLSAYVEDPTGYGRIVRSGNGEVMGIVEEKDATQEQRAINEINTGTYCIDSNVLFHFLSMIENKNKQKEFYLTDIVTLARNFEMKVNALPLDDPSEAIGVNSRNDLAFAESVLLDRVRKRHMENGVTMIMPDSIYIGLDVTIEKDVTIGPFAVIKGNSIIREGAQISAFSYIENSEILKHELVPPFSKKVL
ncbi:Glucosamine-1-phosphate N-acetyltransferase [Dissulfuribacter thermophilus]|uniref:Glucosamine-1-phosphate N-acetyltransferase n=1 Tax=Dissulfuribacter thermophilus TaxID=1156395 RepID=A0A1B9F792_9BACT|nr:sugar phosphate nucleotidyltransferase [Dissulfuribacter thermophilus]OCC15782.1 Glucosamine-1-phosphate N-acetyltransferase [Dissulfuribacter thermophilus]